MVIYGWNQSTFWDRQSNLQKYWLWEQIKYIVVIEQIKQKVIWQILDGICQCDGTRTEKIWCDYGGYQLLNLQSTLALSRIINSIMILCYFFLPDLALFLPLFLPLGDGAALVASACNAASAAAISSSLFLSASKYFCLNASRGRFISALLWSNSACIQKQ